MPGHRPGRLLNPARRWAVRELKLRPGQTVVVGGAPVGWTVALVRELVGPSGAVIVIEADLRRADRAAGAIAERGWGNVRVATGISKPAELPDSAERVFLDDPGLLADTGAVERILGRLESAGRVAGVCRRSEADALGELETRVHALRRESFYLGAGLAFWGQVP